MAGKVSLKLGKGNVFVEKSGTPGMAGILCLKGIPRCFLQLGFWGYLSWRSWRGRTQESGLHKMLLYSVSFHLSLLDRFVNGLTFNVNFTFNRQPLRVQHRALDLTSYFPLEPVLFPKAARGVPLLPPDFTLK